VLIVDVDGVSLSDSMDVAAAASTSSIIVFEVGIVIDPSK
jgi:hypothetical protein